MSSKLDLHNEIRKSKRKGKLLSLLAYTSPAPSGCMNWLGGLSDTGYGICSYKGKTVRVHRLVVELSGKEIPKGMVVMHRCDNPSCINPEHLEVGTQKENCAEPAKYRAVPPRLSEEDYTSAS